MADISRESVHAAMKWPQAQHVLQVYTHSANFQPALTTEPQVLRAQPENLYKFIADYLAALLVTREHLAMACLLCGDACESICHPTLLDELRSQGLEEEEAEKAAEIIVTYFEDGGYKEDNVMMKLIKNTNITKKQLPKVRKAIETAFLKQKLRDTFPEPGPSDSVDSITQAVQHTMKLYEKTKPTREEYATMALKIQAAYKGYGVRKQRISSNSSWPPPSRFSFPEKHVGYSCHGRNHESPTVTTSASSSSDQKSLYPPVCVFDYDDKGDLRDISEKVNSSFDYTSGRETDDLKRISTMDDKMKKISFGVPAQSDTIEYDDDGAEVSANSKISLSDLSDDTKIIEDAIADLDDEYTVGVNVIRGNLKQNGAEASREDHESLTEVKSSKRFVADDETELGDHVDHCHITMNNTFDANCNSNISADFTAKQNNGSAVEIDDDPAESVKTFETSNEDSTIINPLVDQYSGVEEITSQYDINAHEEAEANPVDIRKKDENTKGFLSDYLNNGDIEDIENNADEDTTTMESISLPLDDEENVLPQISLTMKQSFQSQ